MPCFVAVLAYFFPRLAIILTVIFSDYIGLAYKTTIWPLLGFFFAPLTTLAYAFAINQNGAVSGWYLIVFIIAILMDLGAVGGTRHYKKRWWDD
jgi:positive regulator of sigma E activity